MTKSHRPPFAILVDMKYIGIVEIPKDCDRRIHKSTETGEFIDFGPTKEVIPVNEGKMPVCYGFLKGVMNRTEGDEVDLLIFSNTEYKTGDEVEVEVMGIIEREDGDHKIIGRDSTVAIQSWDEVDIDSRDLVLRYFGYKHKIILVNGREGAVVYLNQCSTK